MKPKSWRNSAAWGKAARLAKRMSDGECYLCGQPLDFTIKDRGHPYFVEVDHIIPVDKGGALYEQENLSPVHLQCNRVKGVKSVQDLQLQRVIELMVENSKEIQTTGISWLEEDGANASPQEP